MIGNGDQCIQGIGRQDLKFQIIACIIHFLKETGRFLVADGPSVIAL